jgi:hypothetical protein
MDAVHVADEGHPVALRRPRGLAAIVAGRGQTHRVVLSEPAAVEAETVWFGVGHIGQHGAVGR